MQVAGCVFKDYPEKQVIDNDDTCWFCLSKPKPHKSKLWVTHSIEKDKENVNHPLHTKCALMAYEILSSNNKCFCCQLPVDISTLLSLVPLKAKVGKYLHECEDNLLNIIGVSAASLGVMSMVFGESSYVNEFVPTSDLARKILSNTALGIHYGAILLDDSEEQQTKAKRLLSGVYLASFLIYEGVYVATALREGKIEALIPVIMKLAEYAILYNAVKEGFHIGAVAKKAAYFSAAVGLVVESIIENGKSYSPTFEVGTILGSLGVYAAKPILKYCTNMLTKF